MDTSKTLTDPLTVQTSETPNDPSVNTSNLESTEISNDSATVETTTDSSTLTDPAMVETVKAPTEDPSNVESTEALTNSSTVEKTELSVDRQY